MDIGTLTGQIAIEDQLSDHLTVVANKVREFASGFDGAMGAIATSVGIAAAAVVGLTITIEELGKKGSTILGVENAFDHLAESAGTTGEALRGSLSAGVKETIDEFDLMKDTAKLLGSGMKLSTDQALLMGQAARELGKATGTDAASGLEIMSSALTTGRVRGLQQQIGLIDLKKGEEDFARSLGVTVDELSEAGKLEGKRIAILQATQAYVDRLGVSQLSFKERLQQAEVAVEEWGDSLAKSVASSPAVMGALNAVGDAIQKTFGSAGQTALETITDLINGFANGVAKYGPSVIGLFGNIVDGVKGVFNFIKDQTPLVAIVEALLLPFKELAGALKQFEDSLHGVYQAAGDAGGPITAVADGTGRLLLSSEQVTARLSAQGKEMKVVDGLTVDLNSHTVTLGASMSTAGDRAKFLADKTKDILPSTNASIAKTAELWDQYFSILDKTFGDTLESQNASIDRWYTLQKAALDKTLKVNVDYQNQLAALEAVTLAKRAEAQVNYTMESIKESESIGEAAAAAVAKGVAGMPGVLKTLSQSMGVIPLAAKQSASAMALINTQAGEAGDAINRAMTLAEQSLLPLNAEQLVLIQRMSQAGVSAQQMADVMGVSLARVEDATFSLGKALSTNLTQVLKNIPNTIAGALTGSGGLLGALNAVGSQLGAALGKNLGEGLAKSMGGSLTSGIGQFAGPIGAAVGSLVGPLVDFFANIGGPSKDELAARDAFKSIQLSGETLNQTIQRLSQELIAAGKTGPEALAMVQRALDATHNSAADVNAALGDINSVLDQQKQDSADLDAAIQRYGFSIAELGPTMQKQKLDEQATQLLNDWRLLVGSGIQMTTVNEKMTGSMQDYLDSVRQTGQEVPAAMEPILQKMIDQGLLTDAAGNKITDLKDLGVTFSESMTQGFQKVVDRLDKLLAGLGLVPAALDAIPDVTTKTIRIDTVYTQTGAPGSDAGVDSPVYTARGGRIVAGGVSYYGGGGRVVAFQPRGTDKVPAMLTPGETVSSVADTKSTAENMQVLAEEQQSQGATLDAIKKLLADNPRAVGVAVADAVLLLPRKTA